MPCSITDSRKLNTSNLGVDSSDFDGFVFTGKQWDEDVELYYFNARWYDPETGRFVTEDPIKDSMLWYAYVNNNPMGYTDPTGLYGEESDADYLRYLGAGDDEAEEIAEQNRKWVNENSTSSSNNTTSGTSSTPTSRELNIPELTDLIPIGILSANDQGEIQLDLDALDRLVELAKQSGVTNEELWLAISYDFDLRFIITPGDKFDDNAILPITYGKGFNFTVFENYTTGESYYEEFITSVVNSIGPSINIGASANLTIYAQSFPEGTSSDRVVSSFMGFFNGLSSAYPVSIVSGQDKWVGVSVPLANKSFSKTALNLTTVDYRSINNDYQTSPNESAMTVLEAVGLLGFGQYGISP